MVQLAGNADGAVPGARRRVVLLGSTGSIGCSTLKVAADLPDAIELVGLAARSSAELLGEQARLVRPRSVCLVDASSASRLGDLPPGTARLTGSEGLVELATLPEADIVLIAIVGTAGLAPALAAIRAGKDLALASKEILVMAGGIVMAEARRAGVRVLPVDSEHNAIFQCLEGAAGRPSSDIRRLILTASGGPFRLLPAARLADVTPAQALEHPTWDMGSKISIDSATLFNKGLEMIEARWLFDIPMERVEAVVHPQSIIHSMVEFIDGSTLAQLSYSDMCFPIQYALTWPRRIANSLKPLDFAALGKLEFEPPRFADFPALGLAREAGKRGGTLPAVMNAANEVAVDAFLGGRIRFPAIWETVAQVMSAHAHVAEPDLDAILESDRWARQAAAELC